MLRTVSRNLNVRNAIFGISNSNCQRTTISIPYQPKQLFVMKEFRSLFGTTSKYLAAAEPSSSSSTANPIGSGASKPYGNDKKQKISTFGWFLLIIPISTFGLGYWQVQRKKWKENLIKQVEEQIKQEPANFPEDITELNNMEYRTVRVRGRFLHDKELYLGPRQLGNSGHEGGSGLMSGMRCKIGYQVVTPFQLEDRDHIILVNRGWVSKDNLDPTTRQAGQITEPIEIIGVVRKGDRRPPFAPKSNAERHAFSQIPSPVNYANEKNEEFLEDKIRNKSQQLPQIDNSEKLRSKTCGRWKHNHFIFRDMKRMCQITGAEPYFIDATAQSTIPGGPIGGQTHISLRNEHSSYILTWFSLSGLTSYLWYRRIFKRMG